MNPSKSRVMLVWLFYFCVLLVMSLWVRDIPSQPDAFVFTIEQLAKAGMMADPQHFATAAIDVAKNGWISDKNHFIFNLWPPGFVLLQALIVKTLGFDVPVLLVLMVFVSLVLSIALTLLYLYIQKNMGWKFALFSPLMIFVFPLSRVYLLQPTGISLGEGFAVGFFLSPFCWRCIRCTVERLGRPRTQVSFLRWRPIFAHSLSCSCWLPASQH